MSEPEQPEEAVTIEAADLIPVFVTVGVRTSQGAGPGLRYLPRSEAAAIIGARHGIAGTRPPAGFAGSVETVTAGIAAPRPTPHATRGNVTP